MKITAKCPACQNEYLVPTMLQFARRDEGGRANAHAYICDRCSRKLHHEGKQLHGTPKAHGRTYRLSFMLPANDSRWTLDCRGNLMHYGFSWKTRGNFIEFSSPVTYGFNAISKWADALEFFGVSVATLEAWIPGKSPAKIRIEGINATTAHEVDMMLRK